MNGHIRQRGKNSFELHWRRGGHTRTETVHGTMRDARVRLRALLHAVDPSKITVAEHVASRIEACHAAGKISSRTLETYRTNAKLLSSIGGIPVQKLDTSDVERWHLGVKHLSASARRAAHGVLKRALADAVRHKLCTRNAAADQGPPPAGKPSDVTMLNAEQVASLLSRLDAEPDWKPLVITALYTGLRRGEQLALRWSRIDLDAARMEVTEALDETGGVVTAKPPKTKAGRRIISLPQVVIEALRAHKVRQLEIALLLGLGRPADDALVFPGPDGGFDSPRAHTNRWTRAARRLGVPKTTWHSLRHSHASMLIEAKVPITTIAARLGHADAGVTLEVYSHLFAKDDAEAAAAIDAALGR